MGTNPKRKYESFLGTGKSRGQCISFRPAESLLILPRLDWKLYSFSLGNLSVLEGRIAGTMFNTYLNLYSISPKASVSYEPIYLNLYNISP